MKEVFFVAPPDKKDAHGQRYRRTTDPGNCPTAYAQNGANIGSATGFLYRGEKNLAIFWHQKLLKNKLINSAAGFCPQTKQKFAAMLGSLLRIDNEVWRRKGKA